MNVKHHPIRGGLGGLLMGAGIALLLIVYGSAPFGVATLWIPPLVLLILGVVWGMVAPTRGGDMYVAPAAEPPPVTSADAGPISEPE
jgi:hypothetical protein